jgi:hypothetical protein
MLTTRLRSRRPFVEAQAFMALMLFDVVGALVV